MDWEQVDALALQVERELAEAGYSCSCDEYRGLVDLWRKELKHKEDWYRTSLAYWQVSCRH